MLSSSDAARLVLASAIRDEITTRVNEIRIEVRPSLNPSDRIAAYVGGPDGVRVGAVSLTAPKPTTKVVDYAALMSWVLEHVPTAVVTPSPTVSPSWVDRILKAGGEWTHPETGEVFVVPGIATSDPSPALVVTQTDEAKAWAKAILDLSMTRELVDVDVVPEVTA